MGVEADPPGRPRKLQETPRALGTPTRQLQDNYRTITGQSTGQSTRQSRFLNKMDILRHGEELIKYKLVLLYVRMCVFLTKGDCRVDCPVDCPVIVL